MDSTPPGPPSHTPMVFMTPYLAKRKDGICPSLLLPSSIDPKQSNPGGLSKHYQTKSGLLLQVKCADVKDRAAVEFQTIIDNVKEALEELTGETEDIVSMEFNPKGCEWIMELNPSLNDADQNYYLSVICLANELEGTTNYVVDTRMVLKGEVDPSPLAPTLKGYREAKATFDFVGLQVRKAIVKLEFPEFPEGCKGKPFRDVYQLNARLKSGSFATVCRGTHRATGRKVAIKCVLRKDLPPADDAAIYDECAILASLSHPHIVPLIDFFDEKDCYFIVMELMSGGDLFDRIGKKKAYSEADARDLIVKMLKSVAYCHQHRIAHCDMKPKNLLLMSDDNDSYIKLADFGFAARVHTPKSLSKQCGTPFFVAPEILMRKGYDQAADMWSVGCIIYLLLSGNLPFMGRSQKELFRKIVAGTFDFDDEEWVDISEDAKDLVRKLLIMNPDERITATDAVRHKWLKASRDRLSMITLQGTSQRLKTFNARMKLRSAMIAVDWISSLKRMQWMSTRKLNGSGSASDSDAAGSPSPMLAAARKKAKEAAESEENGEKPAGTTNALLNAARSMKAKEGGTAEASTNSAGKRNILSAAKAMKAMQLKEGEK